MSAVPGADLRHKVACEQERIDEILHEVGRLYYLGAERYGEQLKRLCSDIDERKRRIKNMKNQYDAMKSVRRCPKCQTELNLDYKFCGVCGTDVAHTAVNAGKELEVRDDE
ncbi:MAG: zinc ribbon domain-containing protein [Oscillospiraceae bacterium]|jgi:hypothetical protein|nr:zinc ribbon domain-containing protein [Oscillospiraceae bacterium]